MTQFYGNDISITITNHDTGDVRELKHVKVKNLELLLSENFEQEIILDIVKQSVDNNYMDFLRVEEIYDGCCID